MTGYWHEAHCDCTRIAGGAGSRGMEDDGPGEAQVDRVGGSRRIRASGAAGLAQFALGCFVG